MFDRKVFALQLFKRGLGKNWRLDSEQKEIKESTKNFGEILFEILPSGAKDRSWKVSTDHLLEVHRELVARNLRQQEVLRV